ncbi:retrovirus-related Pol polyprotein from transposon TNT 1-94, partial [Trifolium pratense]
HLVHSWIINSVSESIAQTLVFHENAIDAWEDLQERFAKADRIRIVSLRSAIHSLKQGNRSVLDYYTDMRALWEELNSHRPMPNCTCAHQCRCDAMRAARLYRLEDQIIQFLTGLNEKFSVVRTQVLLMDPLPPINKVYSLVVQEESNHAFLNPVNSTDDDSNVLVNASESRKFSNRGKAPVTKGKGDTRHCTFCDKNGHTVDWCYKKHGNPNVRSNSGVNLVSSDGVDTSMANGNTEVVASSSNSSISQEKYDQLVTLLQQANLIPSTASASTSSSNHIHTTPPLESDIGLLILEQMITFAHLYIGLLHFTKLNLFMSIYLMDVTSKKMIGSGDQADGLYRLLVNEVHPILPIFNFQLSNKTVNLTCTRSNVNATSVIPFHALWHFRLGHLSHRRLSHMSKIVTTPLLQHKSPYQLLHSHIPDLSLVKVFGSLCFASTLTSHRTKLDPRARKSAFLGYKPGYKGFVLYDLHTREIFISRHVQFHEHILPYPTSPSNPVTQWDYFSTIPDSIPSSTASTPSIPSNIPNPSTTPTSSDTPNSITRTSTRSKAPPPYLKDYVCNAIDHSTMKSSGTPYPMSHFLSYHNLSIPHCFFALSLATHIEPKTYAEANKFECWRQAMQVELHALENTGTWVLVDLPPHVKPIGCRWVYKIKHHADGTVERYKARLVAKGYNQIEGLDYFDTFSPVAKLTTVRMVIALASIHNWFLHQLDVNNAFLHGDLQEDVYMTPPPGITNNPSKVCKLVKSLYGLKQASRQWYAKLTSLLLSHGYKQAHSDHSLFTKHDGTHFTLLLVYVDDVILAGNYMAEFTYIKDILHTAFKIKDLGQLKYFLGLEVAHSSKGISLCQRKYCLDLLSDSGFLGAKPITTPSDASLRLHNDIGPIFEDVSAYRRLVGRLLYLTTTRPDITYVTQQLSQFLSRPTQMHYNAALRVLKYLKTSPGRGLFFPRASQLQLLGFSDADWAGCKDSRRSISGQCFFLGQSLVSWRTKKQFTVARSSSEAEYRALASATCELQWLLYLLQDLGVPCSKLPVIYCDNQSALHIAANPVFHERTKHLDIDCHIVREKMLAGVMKLLPVSSKDQIADFFTKALLPQPFGILLAKLGMVDIYHPPTCGRVLEHKTEDNT